MSQHLNKLLDLVKGFRQDAYSSCLYIGDPDKKRFENEVVCSHIHNECNVASTMRASQKERASYDVIVVDGLRNEEEFSFVMGHAYELEPRLLAPGGILIASLKSNHPFGTYFHWLRTACLAYRLNPAANIFVMGQDGPDSYGVIDFHRSNYSWRPTQELVGHIVKDMETHTQKRNRKALDLRRHFDQLRVSSSSVWGFDLGSVSQSQHESSLQSSFGGNEETRRGPVGKRRNEF